jgi:hypothetical protein
VKELEMSETCSTYGGDESSLTICVGKVKRKILLEIFGSRWVSSKNKIRISA